MKDIASAAGVSQPTVSVILNGSKSIKLADETRQRVLNVATKLGYQHRSALHINSRHRKIALLVNAMDMHDPFINAITAAQEAAWSADHLLVVFHYGESRELEEAFIQDIETGGFAGMIYARNMTQELDILPLTTEVPLVLLNCCLTTPQSAIPAVMPANFLGAYQMTRHLLEQGYRHIAMISGEPWAEPSIQREAGFRQALVNADLCPDEYAILPGNWSVKQSYRQTVRLLKNNPRPDAIFCASDFMALGCYQAIQSSNLRIPDDIAVAGYDNQIIASELTPALTTIDLPYDDMGKRAVDILLQQVLPVGLNKLEGELLIRASTRKKP